MPAAALSCRAGGSVEMLGTAHAKSPSAEQTGCTKVRISGTVSRALVARYSGAQIGNQLIRNVLGRLWRLAENEGVLDKPGTQLA